MMKLNSKTEGMMAGVGFSTEESELLGHESITFEVRSCQVGIELYISHRIWPAGGKRMSGRYMLHLYSREAFQALCDLLNSVDAEKPEAV